MIAFTYQMDTRSLDAAIKKYAKTFEQITPTGQHGWTTVHHVFMSQQKKNFIARSRGQKVDGIGWPRISAVTAALRRRGKGTKKLKTYQDLKSKAAKLPVLQDTGMLLGSFSEGTSENVRILRPLSVTAGIRVKYAEKHHYGRRSQSMEPREALSRLEANIAKVTKAGDPGAQSGRRYNKAGDKVLVKIPGVGWRFVKRARKHHSPLYYKLRGFVQKKRSIKLRKRRLLLSPTHREQVILEKAWKAAVLPALEEEFNRKV